MKIVLINLRSKIANVLERKLEDLRGHKKSLTDFESFKRLLEDELFVDHLNKELDSKTFRQFSKNSLELNKIGLE